jgi:hypothetical protein
MAGSWQMEQELGTAKQQLAMLQEEAANTFAELEIAKRMTNELQKTAAKASPPFSSSSVPTPPSSQEREQLEGENSYLAQQLLLAQQASKSPANAGASPTLATPNRPGSPPAAAAAAPSIRVAKAMPPPARFFLPRLGLPLACFSLIPW